MSPADLAEILRVARRRNQERDITGMLLHRNGNFLQVLEGPRERVEALIAKINQDPRHCDLKLLLNVPLLTRAFGTWTMAFEDVSGLNPAEMPGHSRFLTDGFSSTECVRYPHEALRMLHAFAQRQPSAA